MTDAAPLNHRKRVLIVDDSAVVRETLFQVLSSDPRFEVMQPAADPFVAAQRMRDQVPDVILLDVEMPRMDGITFLQRLMAQHPIPVVICSGSADARVMERALAAGAVEVIVKPRLAVKEFFEEQRLRLCDTVAAAAQARLSAMRPNSAAKQGRLTADAVLPPPTPGRVSAMASAAGSGARLVAIGISTGGTEALRVLLQSMPANCPPMVVVQHMPEGFTAAFAARLNQICPQRVAEAQPSQRIEPGLVLIARGDKHLLVRRGVHGLMTDLRDGPLVSRHRPSADVLFRSVAQTAGAAAVGVIMTGMGDDGARGLLEMRQAGATTFGQSEESCVVYGMPREAKARGAVERELSLPQLGRAIQQTAFRV